MKIALYVSGLIRRNELGYQHIKETILDPNKHQMNCVKWAPTSKGYTEYDLPNVPHSALPTPPSTQTHMGRTLIPTR